MKHDKFIDAQRKSNQVVKLYPILTAGQIAERTGLTKGQVYHIVRSEGLNKRKKYRKWSKLEIQFLKTHYSRLGAKPIAELLNKSEPTTKHYAQKLGLKFRGSKYRESIKKGFPKKVFDYRRQALLDEYYGKKTIRELSQLLGLSERQIIRRIWYLRKVRKTNRWGNTKQPNDTIKSRLKNNVNTLE